MNSWLSSTNANNSFPIEFIMIVTAALLLLFSYFLLSRVNFWSLNRKSFTITKLFSAFSLFLIIVLIVKLITGWDFVNTIADLERFISNETVVFFYQKKVFLASFWFLTQIGKSGNNFISNFNLQVLYDFLDSLTLLEESAFVHIMIFIFILLCLFNILSIFFGNELIKYFKLEEKYPRLELFFRLRMRFQRYYLMWNIFLIVLVCFLAIFLNLLVFY